MPADPILDLASRPTLRVEREYPHPIERVWRAVTAPEHLAQWFPSSVELELRPGAKVRFADVEGVVGATGTVEAVEAPRRLAFTWDSDLLTFELEDLGGATRFVLVHVFDDRAGAASFATGWEQCLLALQSVLAGEPLPPPDRGVARHEELVGRFGLAAPEVTETDGRWTVRVERQLTCPASIAWNLWFGTDQQTGEQRQAPGVGEPLTPYMAPDLVVGIMTEVDPHSAFAFDVTDAGGPGDHVRVELSDGTGHGARVVLTVTGTAAAERDAAIENWVSRAIGHLAAMAAEWARTSGVPDVGRR